jgi:glycosyltransferase involved in cell wall biosynthesis
MIIAIDASRAVKAQPTGTELYSARLIEYLAKLDEENTYYLYSPSPPPADFPKLPANFKWKIIPFRRLWTQLRLSWAMLLDKPDVLVVPSHVIPLYAPAKVVTTVHDIAYEVFPDAYSWFARWYLQIGTKRAVTRATRVLTPSQATKDDLVRLYGADMKKIIVTPLGFDPAIKTTVPPAVKKLQPFFFMLGRLETKKNTVLAVKAFAKLKAEDPTIHEKLVLGGKPGHGYDEIKKVIDQLEPAIAKQIIELGYVSDADAAAYRAAATAFLYPSLYEGFGIVLLEAMAAGTPIIAADSSSIPEVVDDAAILIDPQSVDELAHAMKVLATNDLSGSQIVERGKERVKQFSWEKMAVETLSVIKEVGK